MPIITIFGATGTQGGDTYCHFGRTIDEILPVGGAVISAVLADGKYTPRAVSRSLESTGSKALIAKGVELVQGNLWDKESIKNAIRGSEAVFGVHCDFFVGGRNSVELPYSPEYELLGPGDLSG